MTDEFRTIAGESTAATKVEGSRFLALAAPVESKIQAEERLAMVSRQHHDAAHNCYAYRLGTTGNQFRFRDDGEPSGTGGKPILASIDKLGLSNILVVVTRYFGGTKLGTGGLARAYSEAAEQALKEAKAVRRYTTEPMRVTFPHSQIGNVMRIVSKPGIEIEETEYDEEVHLRLLERKSMKSELEHELVENTAGNIRMDNTGTGNRTPETGNKRLNG